RAMRRMRGSFCGYVDSVEEDPQILLFDLRAILNIRGRLAYRVQVYAFNGYVIALDGNFHAIEDLCVSGRLLACEVLNLQNLRLLIYFYRDRKVGVDSPQIVLVSLRDPFDHVSYMGGGGSQHSNLSLPRPHGL